MARYVASARSALVRCTTLATGGPLLEDTGCGAMIPVAYQEWRRLLFAHWPVPAAQLRPIDPRWLEIDEFAGSAWISLVVFMVLRGRPPWVGFEETNVRTYGRLAGDTRGVYFFSLDAASLLAVIGARVALGLPYFWASARER